MIEFQVISWEGPTHEEEETRYLIHIFGRTMDGKSVHLEVPWKPYFFVKGNLGGGLPVVSRKDLWGFQAGKKHIFTQLECGTLKEFRIRQSKYKGRVYEGNIDPILRFMHRTGINATGWIQVSESDTEPATSESTCDINVTAKWDTVKPLDCDLIAPFKICSLDIECYSENGQFPDSMKPSDVCFQIAVTTKCGSEYVDKKIFGVKTEFESERDMLEAFAKHFKKIDPDVVTGWNIFGFDLEYIYNRMCFCKCRDMILGRLYDSNVEMNYKKLSSSALGNNTLKIMRILGRYTFDMYHEVKREHKFESYSLNNVSKIVLGDQKNDMPVHEIFSRFKSGNKSDLEEVAAYCIKDTELPHAICEKLSMFQNLIEMAKACWVPLSYLSERGQQIKVFSQMAQAARELGFMIPVLPKTEGVQGGYQGATVLEAQTGAYYEPITGLDFASLYPSIMCAHNLCYSTYVMDPKYLGLPNVKYETFGEHTFATEVDGKPTESLLPQILVNLKKHRKTAKALMVSKPEMYNIYNGKQLAYKISMNSVYGFTGAMNGILPLVAIASSVTLRGRQMIEESKDYVEKNFPGAKVRYGDSVLPDTPVLTSTGPVMIENLGTKWEEYPGFLKDGDQKEKCELNSVTIWTHAGWQRALRVIRHKCQKKIYRVLTHTGLVDVTEDHSLLGSNLEQLKPKDVSIGQELFHSFPNDMNFDNCECSVDQAYIYGMFVGDGSCGEYSWAINNANRNLLEECKIKLENIYKNSFKILDTLESSGVYKLVPNHGDLKSFTINYRDACYDGKSKKVPFCVLSSEENKQAFLNGLWDSDGCRQDNINGGCHRIDTKNQITAQWYYLLLIQMNYKVSINCRIDKPNVYRLTWTSGKQRRNPKTIKKVSLLHEKYDGYVYDIETEAGTFQAGVGQMIVKNTDSIMVQFAVDGTTQEKIAKSWELGEKASKEISSLFPAPHSLELEKVYWPYVLYSKKRYAAKLWTRARDGTMVCADKLDVKGLQTVRRDSCPFARRILTDILDATMESSDPATAIKIAKEARENLLGGKVLNEELIITKSYRGDDYKSKMPHVTVVEKMRTRNPGSEPQVGTRVAFIIIKNGEKLMSDKAEDPVWAQENNLPIDYLYYFEHQLEKPICDMLEPHVGRDFNIFEKTKTRRITDFFVKK